MVLRNLRPNRLAPYASLGCLLRRPLWRSAGYTAYHDGDDVEDHGADHILQRRAQLKELYLSLLLELGALLEERREFGEPIEALGRVVAEEATNERAHLSLNAPGH